jgi:hypothetical protein
MLKALKTGEKPLVNNIHARIVAVGLLFWLCLSLFYSLNGMDWLTESDSGWFYADSLILNEFPNANMPLYPLYINVMRTILPSVDPLVYMQGICLIAYLASLVVVYEVLKQLNVSFAWEGALLFGVFPLVGLTYGVLPRVNAIIYLLMSLIVYAYMNNRRVLLAVCLALLPLMHKSMWFLVFTLVIWGLWQRKINFLMLIVIILPFTAYWLAGTAYHGDILWLLRWNLSAHIASTSGLPIFNGLIEAFTGGLQGGVGDLIKGLIILIYLFFVMFLISTAIWRKYPFTLTFLLQPIFLGMTLNNSQILSTLVYSSYVVFPLCVYLQHKNFKFLQSHFFWLITLGLCLMSQFAFALYHIHSLSF